MRQLLIVLLAMAISVMVSHAADEQIKPKIAVFPLGGTAKEALRQQCGFSLRAKLDRSDKYEVIDGPKMLEIAGQSADPITYATTEADIRALGKLVEAVIIVWGDMSNTPDGAAIKLNILDIRTPGKPATITKVIKQPTDLRFVSEEILQTLPGIGAFEHPNENPVQNDATAEQLWKTNPNLLPNGDFSTAGRWQGIFEAQKYYVIVSDLLPQDDKVLIHRLKEDGKTNNILAMKLSRYCAENNGLACLSDPIPIQPETRYRLSFRYKSDGPTLHVFIKGYTPADDIKGQKTDREIYRRQVPPSGATNGKWVTVVDELNPQHVAFPVQSLRVDLYAYLSPGTVFFDDVVIKAVGAQSRHASDQAIKKPLDRPKGK